MSFFPRLACLLALIAPPLLGLAPSASAQTSATRSADFLASIGVNTQVQSYGAGAAYTNATGMITDLQYAGIRVLRDGDNAATPGAQLNTMTSLAAAGFHWTIVPTITGNASGYSFVQASRLANVKTIDNLAQPHALVAVEGFNEPDNWMPAVSGCGTSWSCTASGMASYYAAIKADGRLGSLPVWSVTNVGAEASNVGLQFLSNGGSTYADAYNDHVYPLYNHAIGAIDPNGAGLGTFIGTADQLQYQLTQDFVTTYVGHFAGPSLATVLAAPHVSTEFGWRTTDLDARTRGITMVNYYLDSYFVDGFKYAFGYELYDEGDGWGWFSTTGSATSVATDLHNLTTALADPGATAGTFTPGALNYSLTGMPANSHQKLMQTSNGTFKLVLWRDTTNFNFDTKAAIAIASVNIGLTLSGGTAATIKVYDSVAGTTPTQSMTGVTSATIPLSDHPVVLDIVPVSLSTNNFATANGRFQAPNGTNFIPIGINLGQGDMATASQNANATPLLTLYPGINFVRVPVYNASGSTCCNYNPPSYFQNFVNQVTAHGVVVEFEHHVESNGATGGGGQGSDYTGQMLIDENNWYASMAAFYKSNPYVWFGTTNEPPYSPDIPTLSTWHKATYDAIRGTGSNAVLLIQPPGGGNPGVTGPTGGLTMSTYAAMHNVGIDLHYYGWVALRLSSNPTQQQVNDSLSGSVSANQGIIGAQAITSADGPMPVVIAEYGPSTTGSSLDVDGQMVINAVLASGRGSAAWHWGQQDCCNNLGATDGSSLNAFGQQVAAAIAANASLNPSGELLTVNAIPTVFQNTPFVVSGTITNATVAPTLQYQDNGGSWNALPVGATVSATNFSFTHPGMALNPAAKIAVHDANNTAISATGPPFVVRGPESVNNTVATPTTAAATANFTDTFSSLSLHRTWQAGDKWQLVAPDTPDGRGGPNFGEGGTQWWVNPYNPSTPISGIYTASGGLQLGLIATPTAQASYINTQAGTTMPYVGGLLNSSQTSYQKYGYWEISGVTVPRIPGFSFQIDLENVQITGTWPPEIDMRISTDAANVQTVLFQTALGGGQYAQYTTSSASGFDATAAHTYGISWQSTGISFYIDNSLVQSQTIPSSAYTTDPMFMFLLSASNYVGTGNPATGSLPAHATVGAVNVYPTKPGAIGPSAIITDANGDTFQILTDATIAINGGAIPTVSSNVVELAYVNHVVWQLNTSGNWYSYSGSGSWAGPTTTSPITTAPSETLAVSSIPQQVSGIGFTVTGVISNATTVPSLQYQDNGGAWISLPAGASVSTTAFSFTHPGMAVLSANTVAVRDANQTTIFAASNSFAVIAAAVETLTLAPVANQQAGQAFTVTGTIAAAPAGAPTLEYQDNSGTWTDLPAGSNVTATTFSFTHPAMTATSSGVISVRDKAHTGVVSISNTFTVSAVAVETIAINAIATQRVGTTFTVSGSAANVLPGLALQYSDNGGAWIDLPAGATVVSGTAATFSFTHPAMSAAAANTVAIHDAAATATIASSNSFAVLLAESGNNTLVTTAGPSVVDSLGEAFTLNAIQQILVNNAIDPSASAAVALAYVNHVVWYENSGKLWFSKVSAAAAWSTPGTLTSPLPPETLNVATIGPQTAGIAFGISGTITSALVAPSLQYSVSGGPWVAFPAGSQITTTTWSLIVPAIGTAGQATVAVRDAGTPSITAVSNSFTVSAAPVEALAIGTVLAQAQNVAFRVTGTIANASTIPTLQYAVNGGTWLALPTGSPASLVTLSAFAFTVPGIATTGITTIAVRDANQTSVTAVSNSFPVGTIVGESLSLQPIVSQFAATPFPVTGAVLNASAIPTLQYSVSGGTWLALPAGATVTLTGFSFMVPGQSIGQATIAVRDANQTTISAISNSFQIQPAGTETVTVSRIADQPVGLSFSVSGTIANVSAAPTLQYSDNGGSFQAFPPGATITTSTWSFIHPGLAASQSMTVAVRDAGTPSITAVSPAFVVLARESQNLTIVTTVGPQIVDGHGNAYQIAAGKQVSVNGIADSSTSQVIEIAYVNRQLWYENANLQWWTLSTVGTWGPTGGTLSGPVPSSKANIYLTSTARLAVVKGFTVAMPGIVVNDTIVGGSFDVAVTSTLGTVSMPGATGSGTSSMHAIGTLAATNQGLAGLQFTGRTVGAAVVSIVVTDPAQSRAAANVNIAVVRSAATIPAGR